MSGKTTLILTSETPALPAGDAVFLGKWSIDYRQPLSTIRAAEKNVLPYPFDETGALAHAYEYLQQVDKDLFPQLAQLFNKIHQVNKSNRYWRIVTGYWWREFIEIVYERYVCLKAAASQMPDATVNILDEQAYITPYDSKDFGALSKGDRYNHQLYSQIIDFFGWFKSQSLTSEQMALAGIDEVPPLQEGWLNRVKYIMCLLSRGNRQYFASTYLIPHHLVKIALRLGLFPTLDTPRFLVSCTRQIDIKTRAEFNHLRCDDDFEKLLAAMLPVHIPKIYVEDYTGLSKRIRRYFPRKRMRSIMTANGFAYNDGFKQFVAEQTEEHKTPFVILQHGGQYGCAAWHSSEDYEKEIADQYLTYGWQDEINAKAVPFIVNRFKSNEKVTGNRHGNIIWVTASFPRYSYTMYSVPVGPQFVNYLEDQARFLKALPANVREQVRARLYRYAYGWHDMDYLQQLTGEKLVLSNLKAKLAKEAAQSRLVVCTYNATAHLETLALNIPTLLYWNPKHWQLRPEAYAAHQGLREAGILFDDPVKAASQAAAIFENTLAWWQQPDRQRARKVFCEQFAATSPVYETVWQQVFEEV